jgi:hypothetical protein
MIVTLNSILILPAKDGSLRGVGMSFSSQEQKPWIVLVGGFLGSGKTSLIISAACLLQQRGLRCAAISTTKAKNWWTRAMPRGKVCFRVK